MVEIIPDYSEVKTEIERVRLQKKVSTLLKYVSLLEAENDYHVKVSEQEGVIYLTPIYRHARIKNGLFAVASNGDNVTTIDRIVTDSYYGVELSHNKEIIINGQRFIFQNYSWLSA